MPDMTEESYVILLQRIDDLEKKCNMLEESNNKKFSDMTNLFKANMTVHSGNHDTTKSEDRKEYLEKKLKESLK